jgi:hypothetical protein
MKELIGAVVVIALGVAVYIGVGMRGNEPAEPTGHRANQQTGVSTSGVSQQMSERNSRDTAGADERGTRAQDLLASSTGDAAVSEEQRQQIVALLSRQATKPTADPSNLSISVGAAVPRQVSLQPLPPEMVSVMDKFRGDEYLVAAGKLVIVEPKARRIVAIIPLS